MKAAFGSDYISHCCELTVKECVTLDWTDETRALTG